MSQFYFIEKEARLRQDAILAETKGRRLPVGPSSISSQIWTWARPWLWAIQGQIRTWAQNIAPDAGARGVARLAQGSTEPCYED